MVTGTLHPSPVGLVDDQCAAESEMLAKFKFVLIGITTIKYFGHGTTSTVELPLAYTRLMWSIERELLN